MAVGPSRTGFDPERRFSKVRLRAAYGTLADIGQPTYEHTAWIAGQLPALYDPP